MSFEASIKTDSAASVLAQARSELVDAFADLELQVLRCARRTGAQFDARKVQMAQRLKILSKLQPSCQLSKADAAQLKVLTGQCERLLALRAVVVHSRMEVCTCGAAPRALFRNVIDVAVGKEVVAEFPRARFDGELRKVAGLAEAFGKIKSPPAQPSGGAS